MRFKKSNEIIKLSIIYRFCYFSFIIKFQMKIEGNILSNKL